MSADMYMALADLAAIQNGVDGCARAVAWRQSREIANRLALQGGTPNRTVYMALAFCADPATRMCEMTIDRLAIESLIPSKRRDVGPALKRLSTRGLIVIQGEGAYRVPLPDVSSDAGARP